jgi:hypothetical protein
MKLNEMISASRKKNEKFDDVKVDGYYNAWFYGALNLKAVKEGTGIGGSFANWLLEMARIAGVDMIQARILGNKLQQLALDSKHDGAGVMSDAVWYKICQLKKFKGSPIQLEMAICDILNEVSPEVVAENDWE